MWLYLYFVRVDIRLFCDIIDYIFIEGKYCAFIFRLFSKFLLSVGGVEIVVNSNYIVFGFLEFIF